MKTQVGNKKNQEEVIYSSPTPMETKLHISLATFKTLLLKILVTIIKKIRTTFDVEPTIGISSTNKRKT
jgi:hypothetical protein